eukprot:TRINITY_DN20805_c0_g1_i1.p1 TRINITY_DN20805_c0_g1~~TRINITY_DN20805_c0_g1_i1.p1  ORF type:complete len:185 (+),score=27.79 TRINITY_DN20805_c0_g1_i1:53-607(+)
MAKQGELDGLCGMYSIVNLLELKGVPVDSEELVRWIATSDDVIAVMGDNWFGRVFADGLDMDELQILTELVFKKCGMSVTFEVMEWTNITTGVRDLRESLDESFGIIVGMDGLCDHWTVLKRVSKDKLTFYDSGSRKELILSFDKDADESIDIIRCCKHDKNIPDNEYILSNALVIKINPKKHR